MKRLLSILLALVLLLAWIPESAVPVRAADGAYLSMEEACLYLRQKMVERQTLITFQVYSELSNAAQVRDLLLDGAMEHTGVPNEGDYLRWHLFGVTTGSRVDRVEGTVSYFSYDLQMHYFSNAAQEAAVDTAVDSLLNRLSLDGKTDYEKVRAVYDYICEHVAYDHGNAMVSHSAYGALLNNRSVCQGYSTLLYRLLLELGIENRYIYGSLTNKGDHAWNIVKLGSWYYNADTTVDAGREQYQCFLRADTSLPDHVRSEAYRTSDFYLRYPMAPGDYLPSSGGPHTHDYTAAVTEPTCTESGYTIHLCSCGDSYQDTIVAALGHDHQPTVTAPTCWESGYTTYTCSHCADSYQSDWVDTTGHNYTSVVTPPTCTEAGFTTYTCTACEETYVDHYVGVTEHPYETETVDPTCSEKGYTTYTCPDCGNSYVGDWTETVAHSYKDTVTEPTCWVEGYTTHTCENCGHSYQDTPTPTLEHSYTPEITEATCTQQGFTLYTCVCGHQYWDDFVDMLWHDYVDGVCTRCGEEDANAHVHSFSSWKVTAEATCTADGSRSRACSCGETEIEAIAAAGHTEVIDPAVDAGCTAEGLTEGKHCSVCNQVISSQQPVPARGHSWDNGTVTTQPTATEPGVKTYTCTVCGNTKTEEVPATGEETVMGDANGDDRVNFKDAILLLQLASSRITGEEVNTSVMDVNGDGRFNFKDAILMLQIASGRA